MKKKARVAIVGTNGVPAKYGGYETLAENLVINLSTEFDFIIYCSKKQKNKLSNYKGAKLINIPLNANGAIGLIYDTISLFHAWFFADVILYLGPGIGALLWFNKLFRKKVITNHGGLNEWEREKLSKGKKKYAFINHKYAAKFSNINIVDNNILKESILNNFQTDSIVIRYGGDHVSKVEISNDLLNQFPFIKDKYYISVSRAEVDNNIHVLLEAFVEMPTRKLVIISNWEISDYGKILKKKYSEQQNIYLIDAIYDPCKLNALRSNAMIYIHSHAKCGTSPSLVEAINLSLPIISFDVPQNRETLKRNNYFFQNKQELITLINSLTNKECENIRNDSNNLIQHYTWGIIAHEYAEIFNS